MVTDQPEHRRGQRLSHFARFPHWRHTVQRVTLEEVLPSHPAGERPQPGSIVVVKSRRHTTIEKNVVQELGDINFFHTLVTLHGAPGEEDIEAHGVVLACGLLAEA